MKRVITTWMCLNDVCINRCRWHLTVILKWQYNFIFFIFVFICRRQPWRITAVIVNWTGNNKATGTWATRRNTPQTTACPSSTRTVCTVIRVTTMWMSHQDWTGVQRRSCLECGIKTKWVLESPLQTPATLQMKAIKRDIAGRTCSRRKNY